MSHLDGLHDFVTPLRIPECLCLILKKVSDGLNRVATLKFDGERVSFQRRQPFSHIPARQARKGLESEQIPIGELYHGSRPGKKRGLEEGDALAARN